MSDDETLPGAIVIHLFGPPPAIDGAPTVEYRGGVCYPHAPLVSMTARTVTCKRCKEQLDPIDVLRQVARDHALWVRLHEETRTMRKEIEALKEEEKRVKARTKSASRKDAETAVQAERERSLESRRRIAYNADEAIRLMQAIRRAVGVGFENEQR